MGWHWSCETKPDSEAWPPVCRAKVQIPAAGKSFQGPWVRGEREARIQVCHLVSAFLDEGGLSPSSNEQPLDLRQSSSDSLWSEDSCGDICRRFSDLSTQSRQSSFDSLSSEEFF